MKTYYIYILTNNTGTLYIGVTNNLERRLYEHREGVESGFTAKYNIKYLVYFETTSDVSEALHREKQLKGWRREKKLQLIRTMNPGMADLALSNSIRT